MLKSPEQFTQLAGTMTSKESGNNKLREGFVGLAEGLLSSISDVFPECNETRHALELFRVAVKGDDEREDKFVKRCAELFKQNSAKLKNRDVSALFSIAKCLPLLKNLNIEAKWTDPEFTDESKANMWQYLLALETYAGLYCAVPSGVMSRIEKLASSMSSKLEQGALDISSLDISAFGEDLISKLSPEELKEFEGSLPDVYSCVENVASLLAKSAGNDSFDSAALVTKIVQMQSGSGTESGLPLGAFVQEMGASMCCPPNIEPQMLANAAQSLARSSAGSLQQDSKLKRRRKH